MRTAALLIVVTLCMACSAELYEPMKPPFSVWVQDGKPVARIITDSFERGTVQPADLLNEYIEKMTGVKLPVVEQAEGDAPVVYVGPQCGLGRLESKPDLRAEGFVIASQGNDLIISGSTRMGTLHGVCAFLEECLGVRWFWADELGEHVPTVQTLSVGQVRKEQEPDFAYRWVGRTRWSLLNRMNVATGEPDEFKTQWFVHTFLKLVPPEKYWAEHPEYYALRGGERQDPAERWKCVQLCTSNPEVAQAAARTIDEIMQSDPDVDMISVDPEDSQNFCQCENCRALDEPGSDYAGLNSRRLALFYNRVAELVSEKHPNVLTKSIAYQSYVAPPADKSIKLHDNVVIQFCRFEGQDHPLFEPGNPENEQFHAYYLGWKDIARNVIFYEYYYKVSWLHLPWPIIHTLKAELPYLRDQGLMGIATQYTTNFATHGLGYYVAAKLLWDADIDVDELLGDYYQKAFAQAAGPMQDYYERLERAVLESGVNLAGQRPYPEIVALFTPEVMSDLDAAMDRARAAVQNGKARERVERIARGLQYTHMMVDYMGTISAIRGKANHVRWESGLSEDLKQEAKQVAGEKAEAIRQFLQAPENRGAVGGMNNYLELALKPELVLTKLVSLEGVPGEIALTKPQWLRDNPGASSVQVSDRMTLWVYGDDLDFTEGKPEHNILVRDADGNETVVGHVGTQDRPGDGRTQAYIVPGITRDMLVDGKLEIILTNEPEGPFASHFYALYLMPEMADMTEDAATGRITTDLDWVRGRAVGFAEYSYNGLRSYDGDRHPVSIAVPAQ